MTRTWLITGASRGLGLALARTALADGDRVVGTSRSGEIDLPGLRTVALDVTRPADPPRAVAEALAHLGHLDVVVNNAGYGLLGAVEETAPEEEAAVLDANFRGPLRVVRAVLPHLRERGAGHVVNVSSIAALAPGGGSGVYAAAKAALSAVSEALAAELAPFGVHVTSVEPGQLRTDFFSDASIRTVATPLAAYAGTTGAAVAGMRARSGSEPGDPARVAAAIRDAVRASAPPRHLVLGADAVARARANADALRADIDAWEQAFVATSA